MVKNGRIEDNGGMIKESFCRHGKIEDECPLCNEPEEVRANQLTKQNAALRAEVADLNVKFDASDQARRYLSKMYDEKDKAAGKLMVEIDNLRAWKADVEAAHKQVMDEKCPSDEQHCTCVPILRWEIEDLRKRDEVWRGKKEMLENDLGKAWEQLARYREAFLLSRKVVDDCEETLRHVLNYVEGQGLSAEQDVKETIEAIHMIRDGTVRLVEGESK